MKSEGAGAAAEEIEGFLHAAVRAGAARARRGERAAIQPHLLLRLVIDIGQTFGDELLGESVELLKVVAGVKKVRAPVETEPLHIRHDALDVFGFLLGGIRVVKAQVAARIRRVFLREAEIQADALRVADVEVAIRLRREARDHLAAIAPRRDIGGDHFADEIE